MTNERRVLVHPDVDALIAAVSARFLTKLTDLLDAQLLAAGATRKVKCSAGGSGLIQRTM